jgi:hypothetical protein
MLVGILLAILGISSASPVATVTAPVTATGVVVGPRRNGFSDLPSSVAEYNTKESANAIPMFVTASDPSNGQNAITYNQEEIYNAVRVSDTVQSDDIGHEADLVSSLLTGRLRGLATVPG